MSPDKAPRPARPGRPRRYSHPQGPPDQWLNDLSPTALHIVNVARQLLIERGFDALTIENVALEANVAPATVRRLFASKAGLLHAVWDRLQIEPWEALVERVRHVEPLDERLHAYISGLGDLIADPLVAVGLVELAAHGFRDPVMREKLADDYDMARTSTLEVTGLPPAEAAHAERLETLASLIIAVIDGLSLQVAVDPDGVDRDAVFGLLADMVRAQRAAAGGGEAAAE